MPCSKQGKKNASGAGTIRKKQVVRGGKIYTYWEGRYTVGFDSGTGKQIQKSVTGKTQKEVSQRLRGITTDIDQGVYLEPSKLTVGQWLDIWHKEYLGHAKPRTVETYNEDIERHIKPALGAIRLEALTTPEIQKFYNGLLKPENSQKSPLSPKTIHLIHGILHKALQQAVAIGYLRFNPSDSCTLPRVVRKELKPLDEVEINRFMTAAKGDPYEILFLVTLFTGMRKGEIFGLTWDCVDFVRGTILVNKQLQWNKESRTQMLVSTKNGKNRKITPAPFVMALLRRQWAKGAEWRLNAGVAWEDSGLVFTDELGHHVMPYTVYRHYKQLVSAIGRPDARFHDLRHSYAMAAIRAGDDIKTVQSNLGHATAAFTLDVYGHVTDQMQQASAARMEQFIQSVSSW